MEAGPSNSSFSDNQPEQPTTSSHQQDEDYEPKTKQSRTIEQYTRRSIQQMRIPIILPKLPTKNTTTAHGTAVRLIAHPPSIVPSSSNPRPLISLLDRTEFRGRTRVMITQPVMKPKKCYYTELNDIRREFGIPETFDTTKPNTMSGVDLAEKLQTLQRLRGENKFLQESIQTKELACEEKTRAIEQVRRLTSETIEHCQVMRDTLHDVEADNEQLRNQLR